MKQLLAGLVVLMISAFGVLSAEQRATPTSVIQTCLMDNDITVETRGNIDGSAKAYIDAILDMKPKTAMQIMTVEARNQSVVIEGLATLSNYLKKTGPYNGLTLLHTYVPNSRGTGLDVMIHCGSGPESVFVEATPGATQAYVIYSAKTVNNDWAFVVWLELEGDTWRARNIDITPSSIAGHSSDDLLKLAREQRDHGNTLNAQMLYVATEFTINRGKTYQLASVDMLKDDFAKFKGAPEIQGSPPFFLKMSGIIFTVSQVSVIGIDGEIGLTFDLPLKHWKDNMDADQHNRAFLDAFRATHPEYSQSFGFLVARAMKPDGSGGFSTVYENKKGYD